MPWSVLVPVIAASFVGSLHCAGMCGGFVAFYTAGARDHWTERWLPHVGYNGGRLVTYAALGAVAGTLGGAVDLAGEAAGVGRLAAALAGSLMVTWGVVQLLDSVGIGGLGLRVPTRLQAASARVLGALRRLSPVHRAAALGLSSTLLPCGWLYAFALSAAGTGTPHGGALVMVAFWSGTVPMMVGLGVSLQALIGPLRRHVPVLSALALVAVGLFSVLDRTSLPALAGRVGAGVTAGEAPPCCHGDD